MKYFIWLVVIIFLILVGFIFYLYSLVRFDSYNLIDYKPLLTTEIYDRNGELVANVFEDEHRFFVPYEEIPPRIIESLVAIEDTTFFEHSGINFEAIFRALIKDLKAMKLVEGASTITQQIVKNIALTREKKIIRKLKEAILSFEIERVLTKEEILERYLNHVYFGHGYYGIKTASKGYFKKELNNLTLKEIAILIGMPKSPNYYNPTKNYKASLSRANNVLSRLNSLGWIGESEYKAALLEQPIVYDETLTLNKAPYIVDEVIKQASKEFADIKSGGYKIDLGIDLKIQDLSNIALKFGYDKIVERSKEDNVSLLNGAMIVTENKTGNVLALVGGVDYSKSHFNRATQSNRQPGSTFKPFIYQIALDLGYSPMSKIPDISRIYTNTATEEDWKPKNYGNKFKGLITLKEALARSSNLATINLFETIGLESIYPKLIEIGFKNIPKDLSISLGSFGVSPYDFSKFFSIFANEGEMIEPRLITKITNRYNNAIEYNTKKTQFLKPEQNYLMVDMLKTVVREGTGRRAFMEEIELAGKSGTTNNNIDVWFCGFTPDIEILVWYGKDNNTAMMKTETGGAAAAPVAKVFLEEYIKVYPNFTKEFSVPPGAGSTIFEGKKTFFTDSSPLPKSTIVSDEENQGLLF